MRYLVIAAVSAALLLSAGAAAAMPDHPGAPAPTPAPPIVDVITTVLPTGFGNGGGSGPSIPPPSPSTSPSTPSTSPGSITFPSGCRDVDIFAQQTSFLFHSRVYRFHQLKHWCWRGGVLYDERHAWSFDGSATACLGTVYPANAWFFTWWHGKPTSGHYSEQRAHVTNCIFHFGDWKEFYPDVKIWSYADGNYRVDASN